MPEEFPYVYLWEGKRPPVECDWDDPNIRTAILKDIAETAGVSVQDVRVVVNVFRGIDNTVLLTWTSNRVTAIPTRNQKWSVAITLRRPPRSFAVLELADIPLFLRKTIQRQNPFPPKLPVAGSSESA